MSLYIKPVISSPTVENLCGVNCVVGPVFFLFSKNVIGGKKGFEPYLFLKEIF